MYIKVKNIILIPVCFVLALQLGGCIFVDHDHDHDHDRWHHDHPDHDDHPDVVDVHVH